MYFILPVVSICTYFSLVDSAVNSLILLEYLILTLSTYNMQQGNQQETQNYPPQPEISFYVHSVYLPVLKVDYFKEDDESNSQLFVFQL